MATVYLPFNYQDLSVGASAIPELVRVDGTNGPDFGYAFDAAAREDVYIAVPIISYGSGNISVAYQWYSRSGSTTGATIWGARLAAITPGDAQSVETKAWATAATTTTTVNATAKGLTLTTVTITSLDSIANLDLLLLNLYRDAAAGGDTMAGDAILMAGYVSYSDT